MHLALQNYFKQKPSFISVTEFLSQTGGKMDVWFTSDFDTKNAFINLISNISFQERLKTFYISFAILFCMGLNCHSICMKVELGDLLWLHQ